MTGVISIIPAGPIVRQLIPALLFSIAAAAIGLGNSMAAPARGEVAVAFMPFTSETTAWSIILAAGGAVVAPTRLPNIVVAFAPDAEFQDRVRALGAIAFFTATGLCAPTNETPT